MALQVWLPLNGNLDNQGLMDITLTNDGATIDNNGKIGKCYSFNNTHLIIDSLALQHLFSSTVQPFSFTTWIYLNSDETDRVIIFGNYNANPFINWELNSNCTQRLCAGGTSNYTNRTNSTVVPKENWTHIAVTYDGITTTFYQNGVVVGTTSGANTLSSQTSSSRFYLGSDVRNDATRLKGKLNDFRIYDHALSPKEVKEISKGLVLHYPLDNNEDAGEANIVYDCSGYGHHGTMYNNITFENNSARNSKATHFNATNQYIRVTGLYTTGFSNSYSFAWWGKCSTFNNTMHWGFSDGVRLNGIYNGTLWNTGDSSNNPLYIPGTTTQVTAPTTGVWHHFVMTGNGNKCYVYKDGVLWAEAKTYKTITGTTIVFNGWDTGTSYSLNDLTLSDFRLYSTTLSADDVLELYNTSAIIDNMQNLYAYEFVEDDTNEVYKTGVFETFHLFENGIELLHYDKTIYTEPDGSKWIHVTHHNNPANGVFGSTGTWKSGYYIDTNRWYDLEQAIQIMPIYEFMLKQKTTSDATETKWRWTQTIDPMTATWTTVQPGTVTFNTSSGYSSSSYGGLYYRNDNNQRMCIANASNGNWYGGIGVWAAYQGGIPGYPNTTVTSGYVDLYLRIFPDMAIYKNGHITSNHLYEI